MKKSTTFWLGLLAALVILLTSLAAFRVRHVAASAVSTAMRSLEPGKRAQSGASDDGDLKAIRFASNPAPTPPFLVSALDGQVISTAALRGKVVVLAFWATWCPPCREEIPELIELQSRYKDKLVIIGVSMDDDPPSSVHAFAKEMGINYPIVMGTQISEEYGGVPALPTSFVVDTNGRVVQKHVGLYPIEVYDQEVRALLGMHVDVPVETFQDTGEIFLKNAALATELPGVDFKGLSPEQKRAALKRMNSETCTCGCKLTIAQCRINDDSCSVSQAIAAKIVHDVLASKNPLPKTISR